MSEIAVLAGKVALLTGGCGHLGSAMGRALAEAGASVVLTGRDVAKAEAAANSLPVVGNACHFGLALDHMQLESLPERFAAALNLAGKVDVLVNNGHEALADTLSQLLVPK